MRVPIDIMSTSWPSSNISAITAASTPNRKRALQYRYSTGNVHYRYRYSTQPEMCTTVLNLTCALKYSTGNVHFSTRPEVRTTVLNRKCALQYSTGNVHFSTQPEMCTTVLNRKCALEYSTPFKARPCSVYQIRNSNYSRFSSLAVDYGAIPWTLRPWILFTNCEWYRKYLICNLFRNSQKLKKYRYRYKF
jgi:hypothetical protein